MKHNMLFVVLFAGLVLAHRGYAEKTRVDPHAVQLAERAGSLGLVGVQSGGQFIVSGDFNGDGSCDPAVYNEATGQFRVLNSADDYREVDLQITVGGPGFQAMSGDFDGDGLSDFAAYSPSLGEWDMALSSLGYAKVGIRFGGEGYVPIPGDYDGDGITDMAVYNASQGQGMAVMSSHPSEPAQKIPLGGPGYRPCNP